VRGALLLVAFIIAVALDYINGFHDAANSIATVVSRPVLIPMQALAWAAFFNFVAAFGFLVQVAKTAGKGVVERGGGSMGHSGRPHRRDHVESHHLVLWQSLQFFPRADRGLLRRHLAKAGWGALVASSLIKDHRVHGAGPRPLCVILAAHAAIGLGTMAGEWRIVKTMGMRLTKLRPVGGFCAETAGAMMLIGTAVGGIPVSTTHTITGSIMGVGATQRFSAVWWGVAGHVRLGLDPYHSPVRRARRHLAGAAPRVTA
jgi:phosphate/sulfate permease